MLLRVNTEVWAAFFLGKMQVPCDGDGERSLHQAAHGDQTVAEVTPRMGSNRAFACTHERARKPELRQAADMIKNVVADVGGVIDEEFDG